LAAFLVTAVQTSAFARQLAIVNESGQTVTRLYAVASYYDGWGRNIGSIPNGNIFTVNFSNDIRYVKVKAEFSNGTYKYWDSLDLNNVGWIKVTPYGS
jgi:hypothetical protein